jgi:vitamin B12 transporter
MRRYLGIAALLVASTAAADEPVVRAADSPAGAAPEEPVITAPVTVRGRREEPEAPGAKRALEEPAFVTVIPVERGGQSMPVAEVLAEAVGVHVRSLGGLGQFASISLRGASGAQAEILIDGVPLSRVAFSAIDVGTLDLGTFSRVEVFRGGVPAELGGAVLGGAVNFVTGVGPGPDGRHNTVSFGFGSFGARRTRLARHDRFGRWATTLQVGYAGAAGDFAFFDDGGTPLNLQDDKTSTRINNGYDQLDASARVRRGKTELGERVSWKDQGVPGPTGAQAAHAHLSTFRSVTDFHASVLAPPETQRFRLNVRGWALIETQRWRDPMGEVGLAAQDLSYLTAALGSGLDGAWWLGRHILRAALDGRVEVAGEADALNPDAETAGGERFSFGATLADEISLGSEDELVFLPALRVDHLIQRGTATGVGPTGGGSPAEVDETFLSPRVGARWRVTPWLTVKGNVGRYYRPPTLVELFGDRGFLVGNPDLRPETGSSGDLGVVLASAERHGPFDHLYLEAAFFASRPVDLIAVLMNSGRYARATNLGDARVAGHEIALAGRIARAVTLTGNYTFLDSAQDSPLVSYDGKRLPGRPRHEAYVRVDVASRLGPFEVGGWTDATLIAANFLDAGNTNQVPARRLLGVGVRVAPRAGWLVTVEAKNLLDERIEEISLDPAPRPDLATIPRAVSDFLGYPLPGRAFYAAVELGF